MVLTGGMYTAVVKILFVLLFLQLLFDFLSRFLKLYCQYSFPFLSGSKVPFRASFICIIVMVHVRNRTCLLTYLVLNAYS